MAEAAKVKICGLTRRADVLAAERARADYLGVVLSSGFSRSVPRADVTALFAGTRASRVAVLVDETPEVAVACAQALGAEVLQLHGHERPEVLEALRRSGPWTLWKAVRAKAIEDVARAVAEYGEVAHGLLVEGWKEGALGGSGARLALDPAGVRAVIPESLEFVLAGGLAADSVAAAVRGFRPDVVDVSSGVEAAPGLKDPALVTAFVEAARSAAEATAPGGGR